MKSFKICTPKNIEEFFALAKQEGSMTIAGGTDVVPLLRSDAIEPERLIDISGLGLEYILEKADEIRIGACTRLSVIGSSYAVKAGLAGLCEAVNMIGSVQTRNLATLGGNVCSGLPSMDSGPPLMCADARLILVSEDGERELGMEEFLRGPRKTAVKKGELLREIRVKKTLEHQRFGFVKLGRRKELTLAVVNAAVSLGICNGRICEYKASVGACSPTPVRLYSLEEAMKKGNCGNEEMESLVRRDISPIDDIRASAEYRSKMAAVYVRRLTERLITEAMKCEASL
jgi:CO/xanthine dehydrogenase FAD-binding subunit